MVEAAMEERDPSVSSSTDFYESDRKPNTPARDPRTDASAAKRKAEDAGSAAEKKRKLASPSLPAASGLKPCAGLSPAVWQHVFLFCSLAELGRLLQVNRSFHSFLTDVRNVSASKPDSGCVHLLKSESVWASARNALEKKPPKPLPGFSELRMWQLAWSKRCQFCDKLSSFASGEMIWQKGPGLSGVRTIWPFGIRACGPCLMQRCQTDSSLLFSTASALRPGLPFAFVTHDQNYIPAYTLQAATTPAGVEIVKYYYKPHVEEITKELEHALSLGPAAAEEWSKGLDERGKERMKAAENWERWEVRYQWWSDHQEPHPAASRTQSPAPPTHQVSVAPPTRQSYSPVIHAPIPASKYRSVQFAASEGSLHSRFNNTAVVSNLTPSAMTPSHYIQARPPTAPAPGFTPQPIPGSTQPWRGERNLHDANEAKANRKADIERRSQQLRPPIPPNILRHMDSFKAAIQIPHPMNDNAWALLQPRLLSQLPAAQQAETDHVARVASLPTRAAERRHPDINSKEAKEALDREWEESQRPVRDKLSAYADDFINRDWDHGRAVTYDNSPKFAADLLMYVRRMFYADNVTQEAVPARLQQPDGPASHKAKLVLESMKWVYDNKLKPLTEKFRKELFLCYGNGCEGNFKFYGFEGVIQHFGAKHTNAFSVGNVVVAWREAEWPEDTPFHPDPISAKHAYQPTSNMAGHSAYGSYHGGYSRAGTSTPHMQTHVPQASPGPYHYGGQHSGPFAPPHVPPNPVQGYDYNQPYGAGMDSYSYQQMAPPGYGLQGASNGYMTSPAMINPAVAPPPPITQEPDTNGSSTQLRSGDAEHRTPLFDKQVSTIIDMAQDIWKQTSGIKDLPNNLRIYVLLQRAISKFHIEFNHEPSLDHFIDALSSHRIPRALKNAPGLSCKACQDEFSRGSSMSHYSRPEERRTYTFLHLLSHFMTQHARPQIPPPGEGPGFPPLDWKEDMVELPSDRFISGLIHAPGMDDDKLHVIATIFPTLFPTPLPRIGVVDNSNNSRVTPPGDPVTKEARHGPKAGGTSGITTVKSEPSSVVDSPRPSKLSEDEYDPQRPALPMHTNDLAKQPHRKHSYRDSPLPTDRRPRYYAEPRYYMPREPLDDGYSGARDYVEYASGPRRIRDPAPAFEEYHGRRPLYQEHGTVYEPGSGEYVYTHPREGAQAQEYEHAPRHARYLEDDGRQPESRLEEPRAREHNPPRGKSDAERFLEDFIPDQHPRAGATQDSPSQTVPKPSVVEADVDDGSCYTPPPALPAGGDVVDLHRALPAGLHTAPSTVSNGSRYEELRANGRHIPALDPAGGTRRAGPHRRRDRPQEQLPSRYYRYMSVARDDPYGRSSSVNRSHSKRYERYEEQRRRIDQQETPQPNTERDHEPPYSRDQSVDQGPVDDAYYPPARRVPREYVPVQDRLHPYSPPHVRYTGPLEDTYGPPPVYVDEYGRPVDNYEIIRVPRDHRQARGSYVPHAAHNRYVEHDLDRVQYVPVAYDRHQSQRYGDQAEPYVYYEEMERPPPQRRPVFEVEAETAYEPPPPEIQIEGAPSAGGLEGP
ncbi:hypothetical protein BDV95DRAFT_514579 [Massariosphaeria phaeospora]|uniref:DUF7892 domain-containing protein n=1 Tax=Massariosphaeria phaeospora TaxID=100035 RepID=A0A7C8IAK4_9PLEO|nr:hypothetical protein BDV95DRAFT_514579 [Massariosphaeria phaeospora]